MGFFKDLVKIVEKTSISTLTAGAADSLKDFKGKKRLRRFAGRGVKGAALGAGVYFGAPQVGANFGSAAERAARAKEFRKRAEVEYAEAQKKQWVLEITQMGLPPIEATRLWRERTLKANRKANAKSDVASQRHLPQKASLGIDVKANTDTAFMPSGVAIYASIILIVVTLVLVRRL